MATLAAPTAKSLTQSARAETETGRLAYLDNLKVVLIAGVIAAHAATRYIGGGQWLHHEGALGKFLIGVIGVLGMAGGLFWIGLFFLIAGFLAPRSLAHHGPKKFLHDRLIRLGVPFVVYSLVVMPLTLYADYALRYDGAGDPQPFFTFLQREGWDLSPGPLWFVADLLLFSAAYAVWWQIRPRRTIRPVRLRALHLLGLAAAIALPSFFVNQFFPLFTRQFWDLHFSQYPQFIILFWFGAASAEHGWLTSLPDRLWKQCGWAVLMAAAAVPLVGLAGGALSGHTEELTGGWHWQALVIVGIEGLLAVGGSLWLLEYFRRRYNRAQSLLGRKLTRCSYAAYVVHEPLLEGFALTLLPFGLSIVIDFTILAPVCVVASFALAWLIVVRLKWATRIL